MELEKLEKLVLPLRIVEAVFGLIILGLEGHVVNEIDKYFGTGYWASGAIPFLLFCGLWGLIIALILLIIKVVGAQGTAVVIGVAIADVITAILYFAGWVAAASLTYDCSAFVGNVYENACWSAVAAVVFGAFAWVVWVITSIISVLAAIGGAKGGGGGGGGGNEAPASD